MSLTNETYFSAENNLRYMGSTQFKGFMNCEAATLAEIRGEYKPKVTDALLIGSYVDAYYEGTLEQFKTDHPEIFTQKGEPKAQYRHADEVIARAERDEMFKLYMSGEKQVIFTGEIAGVPYKIKVDSYHKDRCIVDLKCIKDFSGVYDSERKKRRNFLDYWGYLIQGAIYQEIVRQNTGKKLPFYIAAVTKEPEPDLEIFFIPDEILHDNLESVISLSPRFEQIKQGKLQPQRCEKCAYCRSTKKLTAAINYLDLIADEIVDSADVDDFI